MADQPSDIEKLPTSAAPALVALELMKYIRQQCEEGAEQNQAKHNILDLYSECLSAVYALGALWSDGDDQE